MSRTIYRSSTFGQLEKYSWLSWKQEGHEYIGILINRSSKEYFTVLALYEDNIPFNSPREYLFYDYEFKRVEMKLKFYPECVEYTKKESKNA